MGKTSQLYIGTSGWSYDSWIGDFYPKGTSKGDMLEYYVQQFETAEINATFYRLPFENMVKGWNNKAPEDFSYSVKGSRQITHYSKMNDVEEYLDRFLGRIGQLGEPLGTIFWQFPPSFKKDLARLSGFLELLPEDHTYAFEFRHVSWLDNEVYELLSKHNAAIVWQSSGKFPDDCTPTTDFIYIRFHGLQGGYKYSYTKEDLKPWADIVRQQLDEGREARLYFNNPGGNAPESARMMEELLLEK